MADDQKYLAAPPERGWSGDRNDFGGGADYRRDQRMILDRLERDDKRLSGHDKKHDDNEQDIRELGDKVVATNMRVTELEGSLNLIAFKAGAWSAVINAIAQIGVLALLWYKFAK